MAGFFTSGKVDTSRFDRDKLPAGPKGSKAVYRVRVTDIADHFGPQAGDRTQVSFVVAAGPKQGSQGAHLIMHKAAKAWMEDKARGEIAASVGAFKGMSRDQAGFKITSANYYSDVRTIQYNDAFKVAETSGAAEDLPLVKSGAEAFLTVVGYFDKGTGKRRFNKGKASVVYELLPLSANLVVSTQFEDVADAEGDDEAPEMPSDEPEVQTMDALAVALSDGWKVNPNAPTYYFKKGEAKQHKEAALRALYTK